MLLTSAYSPIKIVLLDPGRFENDLGLSTLLERLRSLYMEFNSSGTFSLRMNTYPTGITLYNILLSYHQNQKSFVL